MEKVFFLVIFNIHLYTSHKIHSNSCSKPWMVCWMETETHLSTKEQTGSVLGCRQCRRFLCLFHVITNIGVLKGKGCPSGRTDLTELPNTHSSLGLKNWPEPKWKAKSNRNRLTSFGWLVRFGLDENQREQNIISNLHINSREKLQFMATPMPSCKYCIYLAQFHLLLIVCAVL